MNIFWAVNSMKYEAPFNKLTFLVLAQEHYISLSITCFIKMNHFHSFFTEALLLCKSWKHWCTNLIWALLCRALVQDEITRPRNSTCNALAFSLWVSLRRFPPTTLQESQHILFFCIFLFAKLKSKKPSTSGELSVEFSTAEFEMSNFFYIWTCICFSYCCHPLSVVFPLYWRRGGH